MLCQVKGISFHLGHFRLTALRVNTSTTEDTFTNGLCGCGYAFHQLPTTSQHFLTPHMQGVKYQCCVGTTCLNPL